MKVAPVTGRFAILFIFSETSYPGGFHFGSGRQRQPVRFLYVALV